MEETVIEVRTDNSSKEFIKFNRFHMFRRSWYLTFFPPILLIVLGTLAFFDDDRVAAYIMWAAGLLFPLLMLLIVGLTAKWHLKTNKMFANMKNLYYRLDKNALYNEVITPKIKTTLETDWENVYRVYETKDSIYIYISNMQAFIIPTADIITGTREQLIALLKELAGKKYIKR